MRSLFLLLALLLGSCCFPALAADKAVISWGADLTLSQKEQVRQFFPDNDNAEEIVLTHQEECRYLKGLVPDKVMGSLAISSVYVEQLPKGEGIQVKTQNTNWVNGDMFRNVLATAGVTDARVIAAAPVTVSGTAALAGMFKGFEAVTGKKLDQEAKEAAADEMVTTGNLAAGLGDKDKAAELVSLVKEKVAADNLASPEEIKQAVEEAAAEINVKLTKEQIDSLIDLMKKFSNLDIDFQELKTQVKSINDKLNQALADHQEMKGWLQKIMQFLEQSFHKLVDLIQPYLASDKK